MAVTYGPRALNNLVLAPGWDATELDNYRTEDNIGYGQILSEAAAAIGALNAELTIDSLWGGLVSFTDQPTVEYREGGGNAFEEHTEYARPDSYRAATTRHKLPLNMADRRAGRSLGNLRA